MEVESRVSGISLAPPEYYKESSQRVKTDGDRSRVEKKGVEDVGLEADRCIHCDEPGCIGACPSSVDVPRLVGAMSGEVTSLADVLRAKGEFINTFAHDLRAPLGVIIGYISLVEDGYGAPLTPELERWLRPMRKSAEDLLTMLNEFLSFSRLELGKTTLSAEDITLRELVSDLGDGIAPLARAKGLEFEWKVEVDCQVRSDPHKIREIVYNLLTNAVKYTEKGGVALSAGYEQAGDRIWFKVMDTGRGMSEEELAHIFEAFYQAEAPPAPGQTGVGLGLAIVKRLLDLFQGSIEVRSLLDEGSTFQVFLPRVLAASGA